MSEARYCRIYYRVPFSETDAMGIVHHSNHARYLERGRVEFLRLVGFDYTGVMKQGVHFPLTELKVQFKRPLVFDERIVIETRVSHADQVRLNFSYRILPADRLGEPELAHEPLEGKPKVFGETFHCAVNNDGRPVPMPENIFEKIKLLEIP